MRFQRIAIVGVGLIGGSLGLALKRHKSCAHILGVGRDVERLRLARQMGAIDEWQLQSDMDLRDLDLVLLATPVDHILSTLPALRERLKPGAVVTDVGSTKRRICEEAWNCLPSTVEFIGGHPVAGKEVAGIEHSAADLFVGAPYVICPKPGTTGMGLKLLSELVERLGARPWVMSPEDHDRTVARLSHLPQLVSTALAVLSAGERLEIAGSGFRDMTRLAGSPYSVWESILETNGDNIDAALQEIIAHLERIRSALKSHSLSDEFSLAQNIYKSTPQRR